jgi:UDP-galactopyranose mutase
MKIDYLVIGSGLFGSTFARLKAELGFKIFIIEKRNHIGGNCYTEKIHNINVHKYGPHIFHTNDYKIWKFINKFSKFNNYQHRVKVNYKDNIYSFPINLSTMNQIWGITTPQQAIDKVKSFKKKDFESLEDFALSEIGEELYEIFIKGYTTKQWNRPPSELPSFIIKRLPIRYNYDDRYFGDKYQGIPIDGYTAIFEKMLDHPNIKTQINIDFFENKKEFLGFPKIIYTGPIDQFHDYIFGELEYRSLRFENQIIDREDFQGISIINYTDQSVPFTRIIEHKHFEESKSSKTIITKEYPDNYSKDKIPYYPVNDKKNNDLYKKYYELNSNSIICGGRLGSYRYMDMHQVIASAMLFSKKY